VNRDGKIIAPKGSETAFMRKSGEGSENIPIVAECSDTGTVTLPPMTIYKGVRMNEDLTNGAPEDRVFATSPKVLMDSGILYPRFVRLVSRITSMLPVPLLLDGHTSNLSGEILLLAKENYVHFLVFFRT
jgi:hypothetical protein